MCLCGVAVARSPGKRKARVRFPVGAHFSQTFFLIISLIKVIGDYRSIKKELFPLLQ